MLFSSFSGKNGNKIPPIRTSPTQPWGKTIIRVRRENEEQNSQIQPIILAYIKKKNFLKLSRDRSQCTRTFEFAFLFLPLEPII